MLLANAEGYFADAEQPGVGLNGSAILFYQASLSAMNAILAAAGRDVGAGDSGHVVLIGEANSALGEASSELFDRIEQDRRDRNAASYAAVETSALVVQTLRSDARELIDAAERFVAADGA